MLEQETKKKRSHCRLLPEVKVVSELSFVVLLNHDGLGSTLRKIPCLTSNWVKGQMPLEKKKNCRAGERKMSGNGIR